MELKLKGERAKLKPYVRREPLRVEYATDEEVIAGAGGYLIFDTESYPNYFLAAFKNVATGKVIRLEASDTKSFNPRFLSWILHNYTVIGFNSYDFDIPLIWAAYAYPNAKDIKEITNAIIFGGMSRYDLVRKFGFIIFPTKHVDLMEVCPLRGSLKLYAARLHAKRIQDLPFDPNEDLSADEMEIVADYCINGDLIGTGVVLTNLKEQLGLRAELGVEYRCDLMSNSDPQVAEAIVAAELEKFTGIKPTRPKEDKDVIKFKYQVPAFVSFKTPQLQAMLQTVAASEYEAYNGIINMPKAIQELKIMIGRTRYKMGNGGLHSMEKVVGYKANDEFSFFDRDVASYYPKIILNLRLFPKRLGEAFLTVYNALFETRLAAKLAKLFAKSEGLKIAINGIFGKLGSMYSIVYAPELLIQVTMTGQLCLLMLIEMMELEGITAITANTDGVVFKCHKSKIGRMKEVVELWENTTQFATEETEYVGYYSRDVNNYIAIKKPNDKGITEVKGKGAFLNPWHGAQVSGSKLDIFRFHKNPMTTICIEAATQFIIKGTPVLDTIKASNDIREFVAVKNVTGGAHKNNEYLGKVVRWYYAKGIYDAINYIDNNSKVPETDGAKPCMDLPDEFPTDIDYNWYVIRANRILEEIGFSAKAQQISFF